MVQVGELFHDFGVFVSVSFCFSFQSFEVEDDLSLVAVVDVFVADLVGDDSALDLGALLPDQVEPHCHQWVDISRLNKKRGTR